MDTNPQPKTTLHDPEEMLKALQQVVYKHSLRRDVLDIFKYKSERVLNKYHLRGIYVEDKVVIMRPCAHGNDFAVSAECTVSYSNAERREIVVLKHVLQTLYNLEYLTKVIEELPGKNLVCCCAPKLCHGNILTLIANDTKMFFERFELFVHYLHRQNRLGVTNIPLKIIQRFEAILYLLSLKYTYREAKAHLDALDRLMD